MHLGLSCGATVCRKLKSSWAVGWLHAGQPGCLHDAQLERGLFLAKLECMSALQCSGNRRLQALRPSHASNMAREALCPLELSRRLKSVLKFKLPFTVSRHPAGGPPGFANARQEAAATPVCCWMAHPSSSISRADLVDPSADWTVQ